MVGLLNGIVGIYFFAVGDASVLKRDGAFGIFCTSVDAVFERALEGRFGIGAVAESIIFFEDVAGRRRRFFFVPRLIYE